MARQNLRRFSLAFFCSALLSTSFAQDKTFLFPILEKNKIGYINQKGEVVIPPQYFYGGGFAEGLAAVRKDGLYGYIDTKGDFAIQPRFDFATPFQEGHAVVYVDGKPSYIGRNGTQPFRSDFSELAPFNDGLAKVKTHTGKEGLLNTSGRLVIDTVFKSVHSFYNDVAVVEGLRDGTTAEKGRYVREYGLIDRSGKFIVPYGVYDEIKDFENGYAAVDINEREGETAVSGFIDAKGKTVLLRPNKNHSWIDGSLSDNRAKVNLYKHWIPDRKGVRWSSDKSYKGYVNLRGETVLNDTLLDKVTDFAEGRAFIQQKFGDYYLIDTAGKKVSDKGFRTVLHERFQNGLAFVYADGGWGIIDRNAAYVLPPTFQTIDEGGMAGRVFFYGEHATGSDGRSEIIYGIARLDGTKLTPPLFESRDYRGFVNGLLHVNIGGAPAYLDTTGGVVWKASTEKDTAIKRLNIDFMNRGHFYAYSAVETQRYNGWARSRNLPVKADGRNAKQGFHLWVDTTAKAVFADRYEGCVLKVVNNAKGKVLFNAQDSRLYLTIQALDAKGEWRDIGYSPNSWCGNSYHTLALPPKSQWVFTAPVYEGATPTKLRAALRYIDPKEKAQGRRSKEINIYSNEFSGSVNPGQFWRKREYSPVGLMDPYDE